MRAYSRKGLLLLMVVLLLLGAAACTQQKPAVPTPTLVPLNQTPLLPATTGETPSAQGTPPGAVSTAPAPETAGPVAPTNLPTPTTGFPSSQPVATAVPSSGGAVTGGCSHRYVVQRGDWIYQIARKCGVSPQSIIAANPGINPNYIIPGMVLNIP